MKTKQLFAIPVLSVLLLPAAYADTVYTSSAAFSSATSNPTLTTFGTTAYAGQFTTAATPGSTYTVGAVSITPTNVYLNANNANYYTVHGGTPTYPNGNYLAIAGGTPSVNDLVTIAFPSSTAFALALGGLAGPGESFTYTLSDGFTGTYTATGYVTSGGSLDFLGFTSATPITSITLSSVDAGNQADYDNLIYATAATPEPSSLYLLGTGLFGGLAAFRRRLSRKK